jgi:heme o synthase
MQETLKNSNWQETVRSYYQLTKPRIIPLLLITTSASMWLAGEGTVDPLLLLVTNLGGTLAAASAQTLNCIYDGDIDYAMERTRSRPIPSERVQSGHALIFAAVLAALSFWMLVTFANLAAALWTMAGIGFYVVVYTHFLKRHTSQNIVIGGAAGAIPALVGWAAVTGHVNLTAWLLFAIVFIWTPPHFWSLALMLKDDYAKVGIPMLPVVAGAEETTNQIGLYTLLLVPTTGLLVYPLGVSGAVYGVSAFILGLMLFQRVQELMAEPESRDRAKSLFKFSILYLMLLCTAMVVDSLPAVHQFDAQIWQVGQNFAQSIGYFALGLLPQNF